MFFLLISGALRLDLKSSGKLGALSLSYIPSVNLSIIKAVSTVTDALWESSFLLWNIYTHCFPSLSSFSPFLTCQEAP